MIIILKFILTQFIFSKTFLSYRYGYQFVTVFRVFYLFLELNFLATEKVFTLNRPKNEAFSNKKSIARIEGTSKA